MTKTRRAALEKQSGPVIEAMLNALPSQTRGDLLSGLDQFEAQIFFYSALVRAVRHRLKKLPRGIRGKAPKP